MSRFVYFMFSKSFVLSFWTNIQCNQSFNLHLIRQQLLSKKTNVAFKKLARTTIGINPKNTSTSTNKRFWFYSTCLFLFSIRAVCSTKMRRLENICQVFIVNLLVSNLEERKHKVTNSAQKYSTKFSSFKPQYFCILMVCKIRNF